MSNKLLNKYLQPYYIGALMSLLVAGTCAEMAYKTADTESQRDSFNVAETNSNEGMYLLAAIMIMMGLSLSGFLGVIVPSSARYEARLIAKKYILQMMRENPELQAYINVTHNKKALQYLSNSICNDFTDAERDTILKIIQAFEKNKDEVQNTKIYVDAILKIVKKHSETNPGFIPNLRNLIKYSHSTYVVHPAQKTK